ncbi:uncharacterized protein SAPINGB_P001161 [Magnusiomyces paraingens]|uniref:LisH domain-containing protein n=1 Tax=Magnusiomyces paraingens TaxID=2606893 RepID=A0A5E8BAL4_9ASCO|nr:uncharacterized protein SAPINGB_P001161 [Saprochaete ingens]VVT46332.1 unnamed protein product [Saprochaete ingens]
MSNSNTGLIYNQHLSAKIDALIEKYLRERGYDATLKAFTSDLSHEIDTSVVHDDERLEVIVNEYEKYLKAQPVFNSHAATHTPIDPAKRFYYDAARKPSEYPLTSFAATQLVTPFDTLGIVTAVKIISFKTEISSPFFSGHPGPKFPDVCVLASGSDKSLRCYDATRRLQSQQKEKAGSSNSSSSSSSSSSSGAGDEKSALVHVWHGVHGAGAAVRCIVPLGGALVLTSGMDGRHVVTHMGTGLCVGAERAHARFVNATTFDPKSGLLASAGYDGFIKVYRLSVKGDGEDVKVEFTLVGSHKFLQIPTVVEFARLPASAGPLAGRLVLLGCVQDSTRLYYLDVEDGDMNSGDRDALRILSKTNLLDAEYASTFVAFSPMALAIAPDGSGRYAVATSHTPHMRVIIGQLGLEAIDDGEAAVAAAQGNVCENSDPYYVHESKEVEEMRRRNMNNLVLHNIQAHAPQDKFSMPRVRWSTDGNGVWVTGDDGIVRGIEIETGTVVVELGRADSGSDARHTDKVRDLDVWELPAENATDKPTPIVISGGVDRRVIEYFV